MNRSCALFDFQNYSRVFLFTVIFFPSVNFSLTTAEIFPYGILLFVFFRARFYRSTFVFVLTLLFSYVWGVWVWGTWSSDVFRSLLAYLNAVLAFYVVINLSESKHAQLVKCAKIAFFVLIIIGFAQITGFSSVVGFGYILDILMHRGAEGVLGSGRGVSLLSSEPSRAAYELIFIYGALRAISQSRASISWQALDVLMTIFILMVIRSATGLAFWLVYLGGLYRLLLLIPILVFGVIGLSWLSHFESRAVSVMLTVLSQSSVREVWNTVLSASGFRGISVVGAYMYGALNPLGSGLGFWAKSSVSAMSLTGIPPESVPYFVTHQGGAYSPVRPTSYVASLVMDMGYAAVIFVGVVLSRVVRTLNSKEVQALAILFVFYLFVLGAVGNPVPWVCMGLCCANFKVGSKHD